MGNILLRGGASGGTSTSSIYTRVFDCGSSVSVGDIVYPSTGIDNFVVTNVNNTVAEPSIGIVISKPTSVTCTVQIYGECSLIFTGLTRSKKVFLDTDGSLTTSVPSSGYLQKIGNCYENDKVFIDPNEIRVKLNP